MTSTSTEVRAIREFEFEECLDVWATVWPATDGRYFERYLFGDQSFQPEYTRVCVEDGRFVSTAQIVKRIVSCGEFTLTMGGIADVANASAVPSAWLCFAVFTAGDRGDGIRRDGFLAAVCRSARALRSCSAGSARRLRIAYTVSDPYRNEEPSRFIIREYQASDDLDIYRIYEEFDRERPGAVMRSGPYWRDWIGLYRGEFAGGQS